jgi:hypothetical protein
MGRTLSTIEGNPLCNGSIEVQVDDGSLGTDPIAYVDDADWYSRFRMKHESTRAPFPFGRSVGSYKKEVTLANCFRHLDMSLASLITSDFACSFYKPKR